MQLLKLKRSCLFVKYVTLGGLSLFTYAQSFAKYFVGVGEHDITGPIAEVNMLGYARSDQFDDGLHMRLNARAFVIADDMTAKRIVFVSCDLGLLFTSVKQGVMKKLTQQFGGLYTNENVMLSATHTHSSPGGFAHEPLYNITSLGYNKDNYDTIVQGIFLAIVQAHESMQPAEILINRGQITNASKNRSLPAYENDPPEEKAKYPYPFDTQMTLLRFQNGGHEIGMVNWFSLHPVSMSNLNHLVNPDNKGVASYSFEKDKSPGFVAAFAQSNEGDVSPNIDGMPDDPIVHDFVRTKEAALKQYDKAKELYAAATEKLSEGIDYRHSYVDFSNITVATSDPSKPHKTCTASLGYSFAAGTEDGRGSTLFHEGMLVPNPYIDAITAILNKPSDELVACQSPKPILLAVGDVWPMPWVSQVLPLQIFRIGNLALVGVPGEFTTMSGRRLRATIKQILGDSVTDVVIAGLSNAYSGYIATPEEYATQNYEGGFTLYGPYTLPAYQQEFARIATDLRNGTSSLSAPPPPDLESRQLSFQPGVLFDDVPPGKHFGDVVTDVLPSYKSGETVTVTFWGGHPDNHLQSGDTYLAVEKKEGNNWVRVYDDKDWSTFFQWKRVGVSYSNNTVTWEIPSSTVSGEYRIRHFGSYKNGWNRNIYPYEGVSSVFEVHAVE